MHRIDGPGHNNNQFTDGDPQVPTPATTVTADILNALQEEVATVIEEGGGTLNKADNSQLLSKIQALIAEGISPAGFIKSYAAITPPPGYLECNGAPLNRTTYADLFGVIGTVFGATGGSETFNLPDLRAEFVRGWDNGHGEDPARVFGSAQADLLEAHSHPQNRNSNGANPGSYSGSSTVSTVDAGYTTGVTGGSETRPRNVALLYCIKY